VESLRVLGTVGKATTRIMVDAIVRAAGRDLPEPVTVVLSPTAEAQEALAAVGDHRLVVNADAVSTAGLPDSTLTFGLSATAALRASEVDATIDGTEFLLTADGTQHRVALRLLGEHQVTGALAAIAVALLSGIRLEVAISALEELTGLGPGRMEPLPAGNDILIINDAVSAGPLSVAAALKTLALIAGGRRSVAVLGTVDAPGEDPQQAHDRIGRLVVRLNVKKLVVVGHDARHIHNAAGLEGSWDGESVLVDSPTEAYDLLRDELRQEDVVLVKSSEDTGLSTLADQLAGVVR